MTGFDCILGNPPFLNQLETATATVGARARIVRLRSGGAVAGYTDLSATFLDFSVRAVARGGRVALVQPQSLLAARDAAPVRAAVLDDASLAALWISNEHVFPGASVFTCAPVLERGGPRRRPVARFVGARFTPLPDAIVDHDELAAAETWSHLAAAASGIPELSLDGHATLATLADATADFRDQYYGLDGFLVEDAEVPPADRTPERFPPLVTTGLIDLAECRWGTASTRVLKRKWLAPRIDRLRMARDGTLEPWIAARSRPKILLATQTRILEAFVDSAGTLVPSLPLITVVPHRPDDLWKVAAALASPVATAVAFCRYAGAALSVDAIKLSAAQVLRLPLPGESDAERAMFTRGADELRRAHEATTAADRLAELQAFGHTMARAYGLPESQAAEVERWWTARLDAPDQEECDGEAA